MEQQIIRLVLNNSNKNFDNKTEIQVNSVGFNRYVASEGFKFLLDDGTLVQQFLTNEDIIIAQAEKVMNDENPDYSEEELLEMFKLSKNHIVQRALHKLMSNIIIINNPSSADVLFANDIFSVSGTTNFEDGTVATLTCVYPDNTEVTLKTTTISGGTFLFDLISLSGLYGEGNVVLKVKAEDVEASITVELAFHALAITSPTALQQVWVDSTLTIAGTTDFANGSTLQLYKVVNNADIPIGTTTVTNGTFSYNWLVSGNAGSLTLKATCNGVESSVTIELLVHTLTITSPTEMEEIEVGQNLTISGTTDLANGTLVTIYVDETSIGTTTVSQGVYSYEWAVVGTEDTHTISVEASSLTASVEVQFRISAYISILAPTENQVIATNTQFNISAETSYEDGTIIYVYNGVNLLGSYTVENGEISGTAIIPESIVGFGGAYFIEDGEEVPANREANFELTFVHGEVSDSVMVKVDAEGSFDIGEAEAIVKSQPDFSENFVLDNFEAEAEITISA